MSAEATRAITFDAGGTLVAPAEPVGTTYARLARRAGFELGAAAEAAMETGFRRAFAAAPPLAAPVASPAARLAFEQTWWRRIVDGALDFALAQAAAPSGDVREGRDDAAARAELFTAAFAHYARADAWRIYPDVVPVLEELRGRGIELAVVSNFDARLHRLLADLGLGRFFAAMVASSEAGTAKPAPAIFARALRLLGDPPPGACLHVGDSPSEDARGALAAGLRAVLLDRGAATPTAAESEQAPTPAAYPTITTLAALPRHVYSPA